MKNSKTRGLVALGLVITTSLPIVASCTNSSEPNSKLDDLNNVSGALEKDILEENLFQQKVNEITDQYKSDINDICKIKYDYIDTQFSDEKANFLKSSIKNNLIDPHLNLAGSLVKTAILSKNIETFKKELGEQVSILWNKRKQIWNEIRQSRMFNIQEIANLYNNWFTYIDEDSIVNGEFFDWVDYPIIINNVLYGIVVGVSVNFVRKLSELTGWNIEFQDFVLIESSKTIQ